METTITLEDQPKDLQAFIARTNTVPMGEMVVSIKGKTMTVFHTEITPHAEGTGMGKLLLQAMVQYAKKHQLKINPLCLFVLAQFKRHPELYTDVWQKGQTYQ